LQPTPRCIHRAADPGEPFEPGTLSPDATVHGGTLRMLTVLDQYTKEVHVSRPERQIGSSRRYPGG